MFDDAIDPDHLESMLSNGTHVLLVALDGDLVVGQCLGIYLHGPDHPPHLFIDNLGVAPDHRRRGIGKALMERMMALARTAGCHRGWLGAEPSSDSALPFYRALGFGFTQAEFTEFDLR